MIQSTFSSKKNEPHHEKTCCLHLRTTQTQISCTSPLVDQRLVVRCQHSFVYPNCVDLVLLVSAAEQTGMCLSLSGSP